MGLDVVELVLAVEEEFQIVISNEEAYRCETPNILTDVVFSKLRQSQEQTHPSMHGFYTVRKMMINQLNLPREKITPKTKLEHLIPRQNRKTIWQNLLKSLSDGDTIDAHLKRPNKVKILILIISLVVFVISLVATNSLILSTISSFIVALLSYFFTSKFEVEFTKEFFLVKDLIPVVSTLDSKVWTRDEVSSRIKKITIEQLGIKESEFHPNANFVRDFGMD